ncbi:MAG: haloacid dehalogenase-like hydrolase [Flavobacteriales bacterium]
MECLLTWQSPSFNLLGIFRLAYKARGDAVVIASASCAEWVEPFADYWQVNFIGTELQYRSGVFTGSIQGKNCCGAEKLKRLGESYDFEEFYKKIAFGNGRGDRALAAWADGFTRVI